MNLPDREDSQFATHPSDHNCIHVEGASYTGRLARVKRGKELRHRDLKKVQQGLLDQSVYMRGGMHRGAFLTPVPVQPPPAIAQGGPGWPAAGVLFTSAGSKTFCTAGQ
jgi:hypothetical protein